MEEKKLTFWTVRRKMQDNPKQKVVLFYRTEQEAKKASLDKSAEKPVKHTVKPSEYPYSFMFED